MFQIVETFSTKLRISISKGLIKTGRSFDRRIGASKPKQNKKEIDAETSLTERKLTKVDAL
jgi:hypothetical protein